MAGQAPGDTLGLGSRALWPASTHRHRKREKSDSGVTMLTVWTSRAFLTPPDTAQVRVGARGGGGAAAPPPPEPLRHGRRRFCGMRSGQLPGVTWTPPGNPLPPNTSPHCGAPVPGRESSHAGSVLPVGTRDKHKKEMPRPVHTANVTKSPAAWDETEKRPRLAGQGAREVQRTKCQRWPGADRGRGPGARKASSRSGHAWLRAVCACHRELTGPQSMGPARWGNLTWEPCTSPGLSQMALE